MARTGTNDMRRWARLGAEARLTQLRDEIAAIHAAFPELRREGRPRAIAAVSGESESGKEPKKRRRRRRMSAEARKRISDAQKARWARQKARKR